MKMMDAPPADGCSRGHRYGTGFTPSFHSGKLRIRDVGPTSMIPHGLGTKILLETVCVAGYRAPSRRSMLQPVRREGAA